ncbi:MAG: class I SAM-dependent methyltransferase, partial [Rhodoferax sp.]|nr:class I SAM-dependent methyltransferase [Rhodoferax sp.]
MAIDMTCPVCGAAARLTGAIPSFTAVAAAQHFVLAEEDGDRNRKLAEHIAALWRSTSCQLATCTKCELGFAWPFVAGDGEFYNLAYPHSDYPMNKWEFSETVDALRLLPTKGMQALEIGSGFGYFLEMVSPRFFDAANVMAVEYNDVARKRLLAKGHEAVGLDIRSSHFDQYQSRFDFVFMFQVLEHMDGLAALAGRLRYLTKPGAGIFLAVPNAARIAFNEEHASLRDMPPNHISRWTPAAFEAFASLINCEVSASQLEPMSWRNFLRQDLVYAHMRRAQRHGT